MSRNSLSELDRDQNVDAPVLLLVEGRLEKAYALFALVDRLGWRDSVRVESLHGLPQPADAGNLNATKLSNKLDEFRRPANLIVGIWLDVETDRSLRFLQCQAALRKFSWPVPEAELTIQPGEPWATAILLMPHGKGVCFEEALLASCKVPRNVQCAENFLVCVSSGDESAAWCNKVKLQAAWKAQLAVVGSDHPETAVEDSFRGSKMDAIWNQSDAALKPIEDFVRSLVDFSTRISP